MIYSFADFRRHLEKWIEVKDLAAVTIPNHSEAIELAGLPPIETKQLRIAHMLTSEGCSIDEIEFRMIRFFLMHSYLQVYVEEFREAGIFILEDGEQSIAPAKLLRAIHEIFRGDISSNEFAIEPGRVVELANTYPPEWNISDADLK